MSFEDLPPDWPHRPVTDPEITADLLDLVVREQDRAVGALGILVCRPGGSLLQPVVVQVPARTTAKQRRTVVDGVCRAMRTATGGGGGFGILVAVARPGGPVPTQPDLLWRDAAHERCAELGVEMLGAWLVTPGLIRPLPPRAPTQLRSA